MPINHELIAELLIKHNRNWELVVEEYNTTNDKIEINKVKNAHSKWKLKFRQGEIINKLYDHELIAKLLIKHDRNWKLVVEEYNMTTNDQIEIAKVQSAHFSRKYKKEKKSVSYNHELAEELYIKYNGKWKLITEEYNNSTNSTVERIKLTGAHGDWRYQRNLEPIKCKPFNQEVLTELVEYHKSDWKLIQVKLLVK